MLAPGTIMRKSAMEIPARYLKLISEALGTQIRVLSARINKTYDDEVRIEQFKKVKDDIDTLILEQ